MAVLIVRTGFFVSSTYAAAGINQTINFQGKLVDNNGLNVANGNYDIVFSLYAASSGGSPLWTETWNSGTSQVSVQDGVFRVALGTYSSMSTIDFNSDSLYLSVKVGADPEMTPRIRFTSVPAAFIAKTVVDDALDFAQLKDALDLDANLTLTQTTNTWLQSFTGTTTTGFTYNANSLTSGKGLSVSSSATGLTGSVGEFSLTGSNAGNTGNVLRVAQSGASSAAVPLMVTNLGTGLSFRVNDETGDNDSTPFVIDASGNVGIGTTGPGYSLDVNGNARFSGGTIYNGGTGTYWTGDNTTWNYFFTPFGGIQLGPANASWAHIYSTNSLPFYFNTGVAAGAQNAYLAPSSANSYIAASGGNVGIGTTNPSQALHVAGSARITGALYDSSNSAGSNTNVLTSTGTGTAWSNLSASLLPSGTEGQTLYNNAGTWTANSGLYYDDVNGRVGIGTTAPDRKLEIQGGHGSSLLHLQAYVNGGNQDANLFLWASEPGFTYDGTGIGNNWRIDGTGVWGREYTGAGGSYLKLLNNSLGLGVVNSSGTDTLAMTINSTGNVGIGTTNPQVKLHIDNSINSGINEVLRLSYVNAVSAGAQISFYAGSNVTKVGQIENVIDASGGDSSLRLYTFKTGVGLGEKVRIDNNGNVGIGTTSPEAKLHVYSGAIYQQPTAQGMANYLETNRNLFADTTQLNPGILVYGNGSSANQYGMDLGYNGNYRTRIFTGAGVGSDISFATITAGGVPTQNSDFTELMVIKGSGNVGIGTASPAVALEIGNSGNVRIGGLTASSAVYTDANKTLTTTAPSSGTIGYWSRSSTTLSPSTANNIVSIPTSNTTGADLAITNTGVYTGTGILNLTANSLTSGVGMLGSFNGLTTGTGLSLSSTSTVGTGSSSSKLFDIARSGTNSNASHTAYGLSSIVTNTGTKSTNIAGYFSASGATNNYGLIVNSGNVGIGTTAPPNPLTVQYGTGTLQTDLNATTYTSSFSNANSGPYRALYAWGEINPTGASSVSMRTLEGNAIVTAGNTQTISGNITGLLFQSLYRGNSPGSLALARGLAINAGKQDGSGTLAEVNGGYFSTGTYGTSTGTLTLAKGIYVTSAKAAGSTIVDNYGVLIDNMTTGTNNAGLTINEATGTKNTNLLLGTTTIPSGSFSIYNSSADNNYFAGNVGIGTTSPSTALQVAGHISPSTDNTYDLGTSSLRFRDLYLGPNTLHVGTSTTDEGLISYDTSNNILKFNTDNTGNGNIAFFDDALYIDKGNKYIGIGQIPGYKLDVYLNTYDDTVASFSNRDGTCTIGISHGLDCSSDARLKKEVQSIMPENTLEKILSLRPVTYQWNSQTDGDRHIGLIAQELETVFPELVSTDKRGYKTVAYGSFAPLLISSLQGQQGLIHALQEQVQSIDTSHPEASFAAQMTRLDEKVGMWEGLFISMQSLIASVKDSIEGVRNTVGLMRTDLGATQEKVASLSASLANMSDWVDAMREGGVSAQANQSALLDQTATVSSMLVRDTLQVQGKTTTFDLTVLNKLTTGIITLGAGIDGNEINSATGIRFQTLAQGPIDFMNGKVVIGVDGSVEMTHLKLDTTYPERSTIGTTVLPAGETSMTISNSAITGDSMVFITPNSYVESPVYVSGKIPGVGFVLSIPKAISQDTQLQWMIVN